MDSVPLKVCTKCGESKPETREFFYAGKTGKNGLHPHCKVCFKAAVTARRATEPEKTKEIAKRCYAKNRPVFLERMKEYRIESLSDPVKLEAERVRQKEKARRERQAIPDVVNGRMRKSRAKNIEKERARGRTYGRVAYAADPDKFKARTAKQRAERAAVPGEWTGHDINALFKKQLGKCLYCGCKVGDGRGLWEIDHIIPISRGGSNFPENLAIACRTCNRSKNAKLPHEFMPDKFSQS